MIKIGYLQEEKKKNFEKFSKVFRSPAAAVLDGFPVLRRLPDFLLPIRRYSRELHKEEYDLFVGHYLDTKKRVQEGTAKVWNANLWFSPFPYLFILSPLFFRVC